MTPNTTMRTTEKLPKSAATHTPSTLASLRNLTPHSRLTFEDARYLAERQSTKLVELTGASVGGIQEAHLANMSRLRIVREPLSTSGLSYWNGRDWIIILNQADSPARQRFTLLHEFKHIVDHDAQARLYKSDWEAERAADYFAGCVLMPKRDLKRLFCNVTQRPDQLAVHFGVSQQAVSVRLEQTGLLDPPVTTKQGRCARPISTPSWKKQQFRPAYSRRSHA